jgi:hypothetical protein
MMKLFRFIVLLCRINKRHLHLIHSATIHFYLGKCSFNIDEVFGRKLNINCS